MRWKKKMNLLFIIVVVDSSIDSISRRLLLFVDVFLDFISIIILII